MQKINPIIGVLLLLFIFSLAGCGSGTGEDNTPAWKAQHVVFIGLDGWGSYSVEKADMPNVKQLMKEGSYTLQKRTVLPSSSAVNWASMFMGAGPELHGYTTWGSQTPDLPSRELNRNGMFPNIFNLLKEAAPEAEIGAIYEWDGIKYLIDTLSLNYYRNVPNDNKLNTELTRFAVKYVKEKKPTLAAFIYDSPDDVGHADGHDTPGYYAKLKELDDQIGEIINAMKETGMYDNSIIIVTSDHGGIDKGHGGITMMEMETPFIIAGKGIQQGGEFQESMMQFDVAPTIADIFHLGPPQVWVGRSMKQVFY
ncbi:putative phosphodiesterase [Proteiniphilum saccharofermentans]|uniref:Putative phosphodiesterase n=1 Tax=Proteiniphilum saccharofermentans TaxID=1642647 RepID=A0A1R3SYN7_9BACT|nr:MULTISPECIES: alkaline phosphatase [Proteiniphilum]MDY9919031.1 alkaline phosphatase [Proteiniphilum sp.]SCD18922.1 putative phosphodiesterase [Proteiniphilum saccharofermentans]SFS70325.1 Type I phosphodiesterase / nucleotide pyrophosphatase [Porphyromonadaceae bacterium NLAE-zl-C104]